MSDTAVLKPKDLPPTPLVELLPPQDVLSAFDEVVRKGMRPTVTMLDPWYKKGIGGVQEAYDHFIVELLERACELSEHVYLWGFPEVLKARCRDCSASLPSRAAPAHAFVPSAPRHRPRRLRQASLSHARAPREPEARCRARSALLPSRGERRRENGAPGPADRRRWPRPGLGCRQTRLPAGKALSPAASGMSTPPQHQRGQPAASAYLPAAAR